MKPSMSSRSLGSVISSRTAATDRTKNFSPSGKVDDSTASTWLMTMSPSAAKYFGSPATHWLNSIGRTGTSADPASSRPVTAGETILVTLTSKPLMVDFSHLACPTQRTSTSPQRNDHEVVGLSGGDEPGHALERRLAVYHGQPGYAVTAGVGDFFREIADRVADAVGADADRGELAKRAAARVEVTGARVTGDAGPGHRHVVGPAAVDGLLDHTRLCDERAGAEEQRGVADGVDLRACRDTGRVEPDRSAEAGHRRRRTAHERTVDPHESEVVRRAGVRTLLVRALHRDPGVVGERADPAAGFVADDGAERPRPGLAAVGVGLRTPARAVRCLADVRAPRAVDVDEVRGALSALGVEHHARLHRRHRWPRPGAGRRGRAGHEADSCCCDTDGEPGEMTANEGHR